MIAVNALEKFYGAQTLFGNASFQLTPGNRYGLVGANGSGKTTLLRILAGDEEPSSGSVSLPRRLRLGVLRQEQFRFEDEPIVEVVMRGHHQLWQALVDKEALLASDEGFDAERYGVLEDVIASHDGYAFEARSSEILEGLGIPTRLHRQSLSTLSGGFRLRVLLAQVLASEPQCLLLDEPTNHLDILSIRWLERFLTDYQGCAVIISHDHRFLDNVSTHILDIDYETVTLYPGNYSAFVVSKRQERERKEAEAARRQKQVDAHMATVERFRAKATKARQAQSILKQLERVVIERLPPSSRRYPTFRFRQCRPSGKQVLDVEGLAKAYGDNQVLRGVSLTVQRGDRMAVIGPNGIGKSTLLRILVGRTMADAGRVEWGYETYPGYFAQDHREQLGEQQVTIESWLWDACPGENKGFVRNQLGLVLFSGEEAEKKLPSLSGGEAARMVFARLALEKPNVLVLDEPTNHLDLEAIEALVAALEAFDGTIIFVSHDRYFVSRLATRILEITPQGLNDYRGTYDDYLEACGDDHLDAETATLKARRDKRRERAAEGPKPRPTPEERQRQEQLKGLRLRRDVVTGRVEAAEARIGEIDALFCDPGFYDRTAPEAVRALQAEQQRLRAEIEQLMAEWERLEAEIGG